MRSVLSCRKLSVFIVLLMSALCFQANAQSKVEGVVLDQNNIPLMGATVVNENTRKGVVSDIDGNFKIDASMGDVLEVSFVGYTSKKVEVSDQRITIVLQEDVQALSAVVVTGYRKVNHKVFTGATSQVKMKDIKIDGLADVSRLLEGRVAGLNIQNVTGTFGSAPRINIRGGASINSNVQPLWVIDGAVYEDIVTLNLDELISGDAVTLVSSAISGISPSDIEDVQVLKDASATSMYGARALNGVIVITTKSGKRNTKNQITVAYENTFRSHPSYSDYDLLNSQQTMAIYNEMYSKGFLTLEETLFGRRSGVYYLMNHALNTYLPDKDAFALENTPQSRADFLRQYEYANTNWFNYLFKPNSFTHLYSVSLSGGGENTSNYASLSFYQDNGWTVADKVNRLTVNLKNTYYINDDLKTNIAVQGNYRTQQTPGTFSRKKNTSIGVFERDFDINPFNYALSTPRTLRPYDKNGKEEFYRNNWAPFNIFNEYRNNYMDTKVLDFKIHGELEYKFSSELKANLMAVSRRVVTTNEHYIKENSNVVAAYNANSNPIERAENIYLYRDNLQGGYPEKTLPEGGIFNKTENQLESYLLRVSSDYNKTWNRHTLNVFGFSELRYSDRMTTPFQGYGILFKMANHTVVPSAIFNKLRLEDEGYFGLTTMYDRGVTFSASATYGYDSRYILNLVGNYEGSNISGKGGYMRWLPTWNIGGKWNVDQEEWFINGNQKILSSLALRSSYGLTAKMSEKAVSSSAIFIPRATTAYNISDREPTLRLNHLENRDLTWEKMYELNFGIDAGIYDNKWTITLDTYLRNSFDLIDVIRTSGVGGEYLKYVNFADMKTYGLELSVSGAVLHHNDFKWNVTATASYFNQKITRLLSHSNTFDLVTGTGKGNAVGYPRGGLYSFNMKGLNEYGLPTFDFGQYPVREKPFSQSTSVDFFDSKYSLSYLDYNGAIEPNISGGFSNTLSYKGFDLSFFISYQLGNKIRLQPTYDPNFADLNVFSNYYNDRWLTPSDKQKTHVPAIASKDLIKLVGNEDITRAYNTYNYSQYRVADGGFVRMKSISLSYRLPERYANAWAMKSVVLRAQVTNPFLIYSDPLLNGQDPEFFRSGGVSLPIYRQYTTSVSFVF